MKRLLRTCAILLFILVPCAAQAAPSAPDFTLKDLDGKSVTLSSHRGKRPVLLMFWATWCPYCRRQVPNMVSLRKKYTEEKLAIYGVNIREDRSKAASYAEANKINYPLLLDHDSAAADLYGAAGIPLFVLVSTDGNIAMTDHTVSLRTVKKIRSLTRKR